MDHGHNLPAQPSCRPLRVVPLRDYPIEQLASGAQIHHQVHVVAVLEDLPQLHDVPVARQVMHDLHLAADVLRVFGVEELPLGDGLARERPARGAVSGEVGDAELAAAELPAENVGGADIGRGAAEDEGRRGSIGGCVGLKGRRGRDGGGGRISATYLKDEGSEYAVFMKTVMDDFRHEPAYRKCRSTMNSSAIFYTTASAANGNHPMADLSTYLSHGHNM
ncbi:ARM repeat superfamily protein [Striga asiatica]|uniref:ARM repeat superfamily protein n=1 Tax=Striga asiatica TaxID=4170 RepID=A0A5A7RKB9_STRAF|nr:ARM repeat superfamily protein [Striga asiatica]